MTDFIKKLLPWQSEFDHRYACWAKNHNGWAKAKRSNRKLAKSRMKRVVQKQMCDEQEATNERTDSAGAGTVR